MANGFHRRGGCCRPAAEPVQPRPEPIRPSAPAEPPMRRWPHPVQEPLPTGGAEFAALQAALDRQTALLECIAARLSALTGEAQPPSNP